MSARHVTLLATLAAVWGGSYLLIKYALEGFSAAAIVSGRCLLASVVLYVVLRHRGLMATTLGRPEGAAEVGADPEHHRCDGAVPADHVRRARRPERVDRGADLARLAVHRAAGAVHSAVRADRPPPGRRDAARARGRDDRRRCRVCAQRQGVARRTGDDRRGVLLRALELRGEGPLRQARRGPDVVDQRHAGRAHHAPHRPRHDARPHPRRRRGRVTGRARRHRHRAGLRHLLRADRRHRGGARGAGLLPRPGRGAVLRRHLPRRGHHGRRRSSAWC